jgi:hypothetical protein
LLKSPSFSLDLDAWIVEPEPESESEDSDESTEFPSIDVARQKFAEAARSYLYSDDEEKEKHVDEVAEEALPSKQKKRLIKEQMKLDLEASKKRRAFEQENNPYYVKSSTKKGAVAESSASHTPTHARPSKIRTAEELQSPLEIPGVIGLDRYIKQQESTLSWKDAKSEQQQQTKKSRKGKSKKKEGKRSKRQTLSVLSSSDEGPTTVVHQVNRGDGEMPEGALSSNDEVEFFNNSTKLSLGKSRKRIQSLGYGLGRAFA